MGQRVRIAMPMIAKPIHARMERCTLVGCCCCTVRCSIKSCWDHLVLNLCLNRPIQPRLRFASRHVSPCKQMHSLTSTASIPENSTQYSKLGSLEASINSDAESESALS